MTITSITDSFSVSGELCEQDLRYLCENGVSTLINVRPDNEAPEQKTNAQFTLLSQHYGLEYFYIPVSSGQYNEHDIQQFENALTGAEKKVHSFCRTGTRATHLYALAKKEIYTFEQLQTLLTDKGFDLNVISKMFE